jgi:hypothetical protein
MACLRLLTRPPFPPRPLRKVPFFRRRIALSTRLLAARPYLRRPPDFFLAAIGPLPVRATAGAGAIGAPHVSAGKSHLTPR